VNNHLPTEQEFVAGRTGRTVEGARAGVVSRTHRVVREQALNLREQKQKSRSLFVPLALFSSLMIAICYAIWSMLDSYELMTNGVPDASEQILLLVLWLLPVTALVLGLVWFKRGRGRSGNNEVQP
jgi:hypothetical protein